MTNYCKRSGNTLVRSCSTSPILTQVRCAATSTMSPPQSKPSDRCTAGPTGLSSTKHTVCCERAAPSETFRPYEGGYCYVTYQPESVCAAALASIDLTLTPLIRDPSAAPRPARALYRPSGGSEITFEVDARITPHVRHRHKYADTPLPIRHRFAFRDQNGRVICSASTLQDFEQLLRFVPAETVQHHALNGDFSRWTFNVLEDLEFGALLLGAETNSLPATPTTSTIFTNSY
jgi:hypothetical protein